MAVFLQKANCSPHFCLAGKMGSVEKTEPRRHYLHGPRAWSFGTTAKQLRSPWGTCLWAIGHFTGDFYPLLNSEQLLFFSKEKDSFKFTTPKGHIRQQVGRKQFPAVRAPPFLSPHLIPTSPSLPISKLKRKKWAKKPPIRAAQGLLQGSALLFSYYAYYLSHYYPNASESVQNHEGRPHMEN